MPKNKTAKKRIVNKTDNNGGIKIQRKTYTMKDYHSNDGMLTTVWGPGIWHFLHTMSFNYPVSPTTEEKHNYRNFVLSLGGVLPCGKCRKNLKRNLKKYPLKMEHMASRDTFSRYIYTLHEVVNRMLNKKSGLSFEEIRERYEHFRARCVEPNYIHKGNSTNPPLGVDGNISVKKEDGCIEPLYGEKSKCVLQIVPVNKKCETMTIDKKCIKKRLDTHFVKK